MKKHILSLTLLLLYTGATYGGGGWTSGKGNGFFKLAESIIISDKFFLGPGEVVDIRTISLYTSSLYGEYGITNKIDGLLYAPFFVSNTLNEVRFGNDSVEAGDRLDALGDFQVGVKYGLMQDGPIVLSASLILGLPLGKASGGSTGILQTGDGEFNQMIIIDASKSFYPKKFYVSASFGFNNRTKNFSDEIRYSAAFGYQLASLWAIFKLIGRESLMNGDVAATRNTVFANDTEYLSPTFDLLYNFTDAFGVNASAGFAFFGRNILASPNWSLGVHYQLR